MPAALDDVLKVRNLGRTGRKETVDKNEALKTAWEMEKDSVANHHTILQASSLAFLVPGGPSSRLSSCSAF